MPRPADPHAMIALLRAAEAVFIERGLTAAKVGEITARAGVSKGAFYLHFESKEDCFRQIVEAFLVRLAACLDPPPPFAAMTPATFAAHLADWHAHDLSVMGFCWENRSLMKLLFTGGGGVSFAYLIDAFAERRAEAMKALARGLVACGIYRPDVDPEILPALISGAYERLVREMIKQPERPDLEAWSRQAQALFVRGLVTDEVRKVLDGA